MSDDVVTRTRAALAALSASTYGGSAEQGALSQIARENTFIRAARELMPELVAEIETLRHRLAQAQMDAVTDAAALNVLSTEDRQRVTDEAHQLRVDVIDPSGGVEHCAPSQGVEAKNRASATVCWLAYYSDWSGMAVFDNELDALRHAVGKSMEVIELHAGDVRDQIDEAFRKARSR